jgi:exopolysaccharide production protein ExoZ
MKTIVSIQYLRAAAALAVVIYHILQWRKGGFEEGRAGVDVFFVISGVIMWRISERRESRPGVFLWRRLTRVAPAYWFATLLLTAIALAWPAFLPKVRPGFTHVILSLAFIPHFDPLGLPFPLLAPGWTLSYEAAFYVVFAATLLTPRSSRAVWVTSALIAIVGAGFLLPDPAYILGANPMLLEFAAGVWLGKLSADGATPGQAWGWALLGAGVAILAITGVAGWRSELWRPLLWGAPATMIVGGALSLEAGGKILSSEPLLGLGDASYSIYLFHPLAIAAVAHALGDGRSPIFPPLALAAAIAAGLTGRALIERPTIALCRRLRADPLLPRETGKVDRRDSAETEGAQGRKRS